VIERRCLAAVGELQPEAQDVIGQRVVVEVGAVQQVRELPLLSGGEVAQAQVEGEGEPGGICCGVARARPAG